MLVGVVKKQHNGGARQTPNWFNVWLDNLFNCIFKWFAGTHNTHSYLPLHLHLRSISTLYLPTAAPAQVVLLAVGSAYFVFVSRFLHS